MLHQRVPGLGNSVGRQAKARRPFICRAAAEQRPATNIQEPASALPQLAVSSSSSSSSNNNGSSSSASVPGTRSQRPSWGALAPTWNAATRKQLNHLMDLFTIADTDGNGILDRGEVRRLLQSDGRCTSGICLAAQQQWLAESDLDDIMAAYDSSGRGGLTFSEFMELVLDGLLLDGSMDEFRAVFAAADTDGDGSLCCDEMAEVLRQLGRPVSSEELAAIMGEADLDGDARINFNEWLRLFQGRLLDLPRLLRYMKMRPVVLGDEAAPGAAMSRSLASGGLTLVSGEAQLTAVMAGLPRGSLVVLMAGLAGDAVCQATAEAVRELAAVYHRAVFLQLHVDANADNKRLFKTLLLGRYVPAFFFFRAGSLLHSHADARPAVLEAALREHLPANEQPLVPVLQPQQQQQQAPSQQQQQQGQQQQGAGTVLAVSLSSDDAAQLPGGLQAGRAAAAAAGGGSQQQQGEQQQGAGQQQQQRQPEGQGAELASGFSLADLWYNPRGELSDPSRDWLPQ